MNRALKAVIVKMLNNNIIGERHTPESPLIRPKLKYLPRNEQKQFKAEYHILIKDGSIIRQKKKTGKGSDWHISLQPGDKLVEMKRLLCEGELDGINRI